MSPDRVVDYPLGLRSQGPAFKSPSGRFHGNYTASDHPVARPRESVRAPASIRTEIGGSERTPAKAREVPTRRQFDGGRKWLHPGLYFIKTIRKNTGRGWNQFLKSNTVYSSSFEVSDVSGASDSGHIEVDNYVTATTAQQMQQPQQQQQMGQQQAQRFRQQVSPQVAQVVQSLSEVVTAAEHAKTRAAQQGIPQAPQLADDLKGIARPEKDLLARQSTAAQTAGQCAQQVVQQSLQQLQTNSSRGFRNSHNWPSRSASRSSRPVSRFNRSRLSSAGNRDVVARFSPIFPRPGSGHRAVGGDGHRNVPPELTE